MVGRLSLFGCFIQKSILRSTELVLMAGRGDEGDGGQRAGDEPFG
jgi:hypothetical protein